MIRKRGRNSWEIRIYLGEGMKPYTETFHSPIKSVVQQRENELKKQFSRGGPKREIMTLGQHLDEWLISKKRAVTDVTWRGYHKHIRLIKPYVEHLNLWTLDADALETAIVKSPLGTYSPRYQKNVLDTLKTAIRAAIVKKRAPQDALLGLESVNVPKKKRQVLEREEIVELLEVLKEYKHGLVVRVLLVSGARLGEILGLTWDRVNFERSAITIDQAIDTQKRRLKADTKTENAPRTITLDKTTMDMLYQHKQNSKTDVVRPISKEHHLVFHSKDGGPLYYNATRRTLLRALKIINHEPIRIHDIRHSVITLLLQEGVPVITVAALVGQDPETTNRVYAHVARIGQGVFYGD